MLVFPTPHSLLPKYIHVPGPKGAQMAAFLLEKAGGRLEILKLMKLMYLADREAMAALVRDFDELRKQALAELCPEDLEHFQKIERWLRGLSALGWATSWMGPNPVSAVALGVGT